MHPPAIARTQADREARRLATMALRRSDPSLSLVQMVAILTAQGWRTSIGTIRRDMDVVMAQWRIESVEQLAKLKAHQLMQIEDLMVSWYPRAHTEPEAFDRVIKLLQERAKLYDMYSAERIEIDQQHTERIELVIRTTNEDGSSGDTRLGYPALEAGGIPL